MEPNPEDRRNYYVNLLIMLLIRFPEVFSINYNIINDSCRITFMLSGPLQGDNYQALKKGLREAVDAYQELQEEDPIRLKISKQSYAKVSLVEIQLAVDALLPEVVGLIAAFMQQQLEERLLVEPENHFGEDEIINPEDYIDFFLKHHHDKRQENLFAFREAGRVYIYDR